MFVTISDTACFERIQMEGARLSGNEYVKTFKTFRKGTTSSRNNIIKIVIQRNGLNESPRKVLSIGAGTGAIEVAMVTEMDLKMDYLYAIEPLADHLEPLQSALNNLGVKHDIDTKCFDEEFQFPSDLEDIGGGFDFILMSHCVYYFKNPYATILHASSFLKNSGTLLLLVQGESVGSEMHRYLSSVGGNPEEFAIANHSVTWEVLAPGLVENCPQLTFETFEGMRDIDVDDFVRQVDHPDADDAISFRLQCSYKRLPKDIQQHIHKMVMSKAVLIDGKYFIKSPSTGFELHLVNE